MEIEGNGIEFSGEIRRTATFRVYFETYNELSVSEFKLTYIFEHGV